MVYEKFKSESGTAMIVSLVVTILVSVLASSYMTMVAYESRHSIHQSQRTQLLFLAESGVQKGLYFLNNQSDRPAEWIDENGVLLSSPYDEADAEDELENFNSQNWYVDGRDHYEDGTLDGGGSHLPAIVIANLGDDLPDQLQGNGKGKGGGNWEDQVIGRDGIGEDAIEENDDLPKDLNQILLYYENHPNMTDLSGTGTHAGHTAFGGPGNYGIFYADLSQGRLHFSGQAEGYGILVLEGNGEIKITGQFEWEGVIVCAGDAHITATGGGNSVHVLGGVMIANGTADMRGGADLYYSSRVIDNISSQSAKFTVNAWSGGWGNSL